jgi:ABC-type Zn uptake system ZnuABC Zn-binding protein ZnuA
MNDLILVFGLGILDFRHQGQAMNKQSQIPESQSKIPNPQSKIPKGLVLFCLLWTAIVGLSSLSAAGSDSSDKLTVYTVSYPMKYFAERIAANHAKVVFPAPADEDPAFWIPDLQTIGAYQQADLIILNGATYAGWIEKVSLPRSKLVNTSVKFGEYLSEVQGPVHQS